MTVSVAVPWRAGDPARERNLRYVRRFWDGFGWPVILGDSEHRVFNRSAARNHAARQTGSDLVVFADADIVGDPDAILRAAAWVLESRTAAWPHTITHLLSRADTRLVHEGAAPTMRGVRLFTGSPSGILIVHRELYESTGGWDEGFDGGWGFEDVAYAWTLRTLADCRRFDGRLTHLWHPTAKEKSAAIGYRTTNRARRDRYQAANGNPEAMRALIGALHG